MKQPTATERPKLECKKIARKMRDAQDDKQHYFFAFLTLAERTYSKQFGIIVNDNQKTNAFQRRRKKISIYIDDNKLLSLRE